MKNIIEVSNGRFGIVVCYMFGKDGIWICVIASSLFYVSDVIVHCFLGGTLVEWGKLCGVGVYVVWCQCVRIAVLCMNCSAVCS